MQALYCYPASPLSPSVSIAAIQSIREGGFTKKKKKNNNLQEKVQESMLRSTLAQGPLTPLTIRSKVKRPQFVV